MDLAPLFSPFTSPDSLRQTLRRHVCHAPWRYKDTPRQWGSWVRGNLSLVFEEARRKGSYTVARAAVEVVLEMQVEQQRKQQQQFLMEPAWVKNALAASRTPEELREMELLFLQQRRLAGGMETERQLFPSSTEADGNALPPALMDSVNTGDALERGGALNSSLLAAGYTGAALSELRHRRDHAVTAPNASFSRYFMRQGLVADEVELMQLFNAMRGRQPATFRVHTSQMYGQAVMELLRGRPGIEPLLWLPPMCGAFTMLDAPDTPHSVLLANRQLLRALANERLISFQSTSSMLPVLLLDPQPGEAVLDMCASPGSKTSLILDYMSDASRESTCAALGSCVVANDAVSARCRPLAQRLQSVYPGVAVTQLQGQAFPVQPVSAGGVRYDKVLVDAPCSGEARMRRDAVSWRLWHPLRAHDFVPAQVALLRRAVELCAAGGRIVYSTCTLNPLENEAVVATVLADGGVELERPPRAVAQSSAWSFSRGLRRWLVPSRAGGFLHSFAEAQAKGEAAAAELFPLEGCEAIQAALESCCLRVLPHRNGGAEGFFLATLRKKSHTAPLLPSSPRRAEANNNNTSSSIGNNNHTITATTSNSALVVDSILHARGVVRLAAGNMLVQRHLSCFFNDNAVQVERFLTKHNLCVAWHEGQGLLLVSKSTWDHLKVIPPSPAPSALLELGVVVTDAATGRLTESGAFHLRPHATSRVLQLPLPELQWLLSHHVLKIKELQEDPTVLARRIVASMEPAHLGAEIEQRKTPLPWVAHVLEAVAEREGNFIVSCLSSSTGTRSHNIGANADNNELASISIPVLVRRSLEVELHLSLSHDARQRCMAVIGRLMSHAKRADAPMVEKQRMQVGARYNVSAIMTSKGLEGRRLTPQQQHRKLFSSPPSKVPVETNTTTNHGRQQKQEKRHFFEI
ncbi:tRNA (cytosine34-C5)-methyltransferase [Trypanosoma grayi]|uniref:tRNA (cytosine34-C5)-methyltransferase n=1 Tax=Trypanosoma grayi TaxID=71804 RepID=UPI0004F4861D|nr:tRNA (cytosine34-C5)-methyltransferase [Trypanosoma grayi]KEG06262.1 tRNA (cytosine34-C5)-methyltransferase [Trypanosoma grayi]